MIDQDRRNAAIERAITHAILSGRSGRMIAVLVAVTTVLSAGAFGPETRRHLDRREPTTFVIVDEAGQPISGATFRYRDRTRKSGRTGVIGMNLREPVAGVVSADGKLDEPVVLAPGDQRDEVVLLDREGPDGTRVALHFGGDVMLGRRYQEPGRRGTPVVDDAESARGVVSDIAPITAAGDLTVVNLETVIGAHGDDLALTGKRFLLQSPRVITDMLQELGVDAVTLGNNHVYDWGREGVETTLAALEPAGIVQSGGGLTADEAVRGVLVPAAGRLIGLVSATTVDGDFVNDQLPGRDDPVPSDVAAGERWQFEERTFGFGETGEPGYMSVRERRAGTAWRMFRRREPDLTVDQTSALWAGLVEVYPELQDWTARRGHGGAAGYEREVVAAQIESLRDQGAESVIVQFHAGYQFSNRPSPATLNMSRWAVDDGADFVISHHPHVLQGFEWYKGRLIAHSLGNFVFDQDFQVTYPSMMLRLVVDDAGLVDARVVPVMIDDYRPVAVAGSGAERIVRLLDTRSALPGVTSRVDGLRPGVVVSDDDETAATPAAVRLDRNTGVIEHDRLETTVAVSLGVDDAMDVPPCRSIRVDDLPTAVEYGVDRFGWGVMDDVTADWRRRSPMHWVLRSPGGDGPTLGKGVSGRATDDAIQITALSSKTAYARTVSRIPTKMHHWWAEPDVPIDAPPTFTFEFDARRTGGADGTVRFQAFHVSDTDPTNDPSSTLVAEWEQPIGLTDHDEWQHIEIALDRLTEPAGDDELSVDAVMVTFSTPAARNQQFRFDNVKFMEWRRAPDSDLPIWEEVDALRTDAAVRFDLTESGCTSDG